MRLSSVVVANPSSSTPSMLMALLPFQCTLHPLVDEAHDQDEEENHHRPEAEAADLVQRHRPGKQERDLQIEKDEQDRDQVVAHVELHARVLERLEAAFVRRQLLAVGVVRPESRAGGDQDAAEHQRDDDEEQDWEIVFEHGINSGGKAPYRWPALARPLSQKPYLSQNRGLGPEVLAFRSKSPFYGTDGETRTLTAFATAPSRRRVYQFHHVGMVGFDASPRSKRARLNAALLLLLYYFGTSFAFDFSASDALPVSGAAGAGICCSALGCSLTVSITPPPARGLCVTR